MKLTALIMTIALFQVSAASLAQKVNLDKKNAPLKAVFNELAKQTGYDFLVDAKALEKAKPVTVNIKNVSLEQALDICFQGQPLEYSIDDKSVVIREKEKTIIDRVKEYMNAVMVTGTVVDEKGAALPGVSVQIKGTSKTVATSSAGTFSISADKGAVLVFRYIGFEAKEVTVGNETNLKIILREDQKALNEVVVVGYGTSTKKELTSAITTVKSEDFNAGVVTSPAALLEGKVAGLNITSDGNPNGAATVTLRGPSSLRAGAASSPFYIIDGVPGADFNLVAPSDIASIDVLKDASASAIYGTRATNGVIIVTTKKAKAGQLRMTYDAYASIEKIANQFDLASADQLRAYAAATGQSFTPENDNGGNTDWRKVTQRDNGFAQNHNLSFGGGSEKTTFGGSLNYLENQGIIKNTGFDRFVGRVNLSQKTLNDKLKLDFSLSNSVTTSDLLVNDIPLTKLDGKDPGFFKSIIQYLPTRTVYNPDGSLYVDPTLVLGYNPLGLITNDTYKQKINLLLGNVKGELKLPAGILYNFNLAYQNRTTFNDTYYNSKSELAQNLNGSAIRSTYQDTKKLFENYLSYAHKWGDDHDFKALVGYAYDETTTGNGFQSSNQNFISDETSYNNLALGTAPAGYRVNYGAVQVETLRLISFYSRLNYSYLGKYIFQASVRRDGSNAFGANNRWGYFPAGSAAWRIIDEPFMKTQTLFDDLKVRVGYGKTGNSQGFPAYTPLTQYGTTGNFYYNSAFIGAIGPTQNPNPDLKWETTGTINAGIDFSILKGRLGGSVDLYQKKTTDMISVIPVSTVTNLVANLTANVGSMDNKGVEISLNGTPVKSESFTWETYGNISFNKNKITSLGTNLSKIYAGVPEGPGQSGVTVSIIEAGYPLGQFFTLQYLGLTNGVSTFLGADGQPTITPKSTDQTYAGNAQPTYIFGWGNNFSYKNFSLNFFFRGQGGNKIMNASLASYNQPAQVTTHNVPVLTLSEPVTDINAHRYSTRYLEDGAFVRLSNATLAYKFKVAGNYVHGIRFYVTGTNLLLITKYKGVDPELNLSLNNQVSGQFIGVDSNNFYPRTRSFLAGIQLDL
jgi:TonB-linked SusC/RagA family outer membrane protein